MVLAVLKRVKEEKIKYVAILYFINTRIKWYLYVKFIRECCWRDMYE